MLNTPLLYNGTYVPPELTTKYVFSNVTANTTNAATLIASYNSGDTDASIIESNMGLGTPSILIVEVAYTKLTRFLKETINIDKTSSTTFWNDIKNWLYLNNAVDITYNSGLDKWSINDVNNKSYLYIKYISG